ncbi:MAG: molybdopterin molybdotransferase MoeA [Synergistaceae bacterium]|jgi:molybdopterin molybdotransferase|nr:molybdopterin molybdotransferase MoeA [Synergistaceae bacterium]
MAGFVEEVKSIDVCLVMAAASLGFPWEVPSRSVTLDESFMTRAARDIMSGEMLPPFTRSLRDGYAVRHSDTTGASCGSPVFLRLSGEVMMGNAPGFAVPHEGAALIPTGGMMPEGADAVVMIEDTEQSGGWIEVRASVQRGENLVFAGEEISQGDVLVHRGELIDAQTQGLLAAFGVSRLETTDIKIGVLSTGDEIVPVPTAPLPHGYIRDANNNVIRSLLRRYGFASESFGIAPDGWAELEPRAREVVSKCDVTLLSGGSSVGARDNTARILKSMPDPGLILHGINMSPGKPTLIGGAAADKKLVIGLPGHPLSCVAAVVFVVLPMLLSLTGAKSSHVGRYSVMPLERDVQGRTGADEFIPMALAGGAARPLTAKSGYVSAMRDADGFIRLRPDKETLRAGEAAEIWLW